MCTDYELIIQNIKSKELFDVTSLASDIQYTTALDGQAGVFSFNLEKDPNDILEICLGSIVYFKAMEDGVKKLIFYGKINSLGTDGTEAYNVVAYDQIVTLKNEDYVNWMGGTIVDIFNEICLRMNIVNKKIIAQSNYKTEPKLFAKETYYSMFNDIAISTLLKDPKQPRFFIRDNFGTLELDEISSSTSRTNYVVGDESLLMDYTYKTDIENDTYTRVNVVKTNKDSGIQNFVVAEDRVNLNYWGIKQLIKEVSEETNDAQMKDTASKLLKLKNRSKKTMNLNAIGIGDFKCGSGFKLQLKKIGIDQWVYIKTITHNFDNDLHTMDMEVIFVNYER